MAKHSKTNSQFWEGRVYLPTYTKNGRTHRLPDYVVKIQHAGERHTLPLRTPSKQEAGRRARDLYLQLKAGGWAAVRAATAPETITVDEFLAEARLGLSSNTRVTFGTFTQALRQVMAFLGGVPTSKYRSRFRDAVGALPMSLLTPESVERWREAYVAQRVAENPGDLRVARRRANYVCQTAARLFSDKVLSRINVPLSNPFAGVVLYPERVGRYVSRFDPQELMDAAQAQLAGTEILKLLVLCLFAGLRKNEADKLLWSQVNLETGVIEIRDTQYIRVKTDSSMDRINLDEDAVTLLREYRARRPEDEFVLMGAPYRPDDERRRYRAKHAMEDAIKWLRAWTAKDGSQPFKDVQKPLHTLRKELGAIITTKYGIYAAKHVLRHSNIQTTASFYADQKEKVTTGLRLQAQVEEEPRTAPHDRP